MSVSSWEYLLVGGTLVRFIVGHDGDTLLPHHADVCSIAITGPEEHGQQDGLGDGAPQHAQHHPVVGAVKLQTGKAHHQNGEASQEVIDEDDATDQIGDLQRRLERL